MPLSPVAGDAVLTGLNHLTLAVRDIDRSVVFYRDLLGLRMEAQWATGAYLSLSGLWLCLSLDDHKADGVQQDYTHYAFSIAQPAFADFVGRMRLGGVVEWKDNRSEGDSFYFLDPDGHKLEAHVGNLATRLAECRRRPYPGMRFPD